MRHQENTRGSDGNDRGECSVCADYVAVTGALEVRALVVFLVSWRGCFVRLEQFCMHVWSGGAAIGGHRV